MGLGPGDSDGGEGRPGSIGAGEGEWCSMLGAGALAGVWVGAKKIGVGEGALCFVLGAGEDSVCGDGIGEWTGTAVGGRTTGWRDGGKPIGAGIGG